MAPAMISSRYLLVKPLGGGASGDVWEAHDLHQEQDVAIKVMKQLPATGPWQEAQMLTAMSGEYILPVLNADQDAGTPYLVTELASGGALDRRIPPHGVAEHTAIGWMREACRGVQRCHSQGLLHRDIKPENIFFRDDHRALLGDFGLAWNMRRGPASLAGTPGYLAPEVAGGRPCTVASDVYSLGALLHCMLTGHGPHPGLPVGGTVGDLLAHISTTPPEDINVAAPHVTIGLRRIAAGCVSATVTDRPANAAVFDTELGRLARPSRAWQRVPAHQGHTACWSGPATEVSEMRVCVLDVSTGSASRHRIECGWPTKGRISHQHSRSAVPRAQLASKLRRVFAQLSK